MLKFIVYDICTRFEKYGTDTRRTLINMYISMYCWTVLAFLFLVHFPETVRFIYGPFSEMFCNLHLIIRYSIINLFLLIANASIFTKYIFIFWLKNPGVFNEEFWYLFSWIYLPGIAVLFQGTTFFLASLPPITFYICSGKDPGESYKSLSKYDGKFEVLTLLTIIFHLFVYLRIYIFKRKSKSIFPPSKGSTFMEMKSEELANYFLNHVLNIIVIATSIFVASKLNGLEPEDFGKYPFNILFYYRSLISPVVAILLLTISFMVKKNYVKAFIDEFRSLYCVNMDCK